MTIHSSSWRARLFSMTLILALLFPSLWPVVVLAQPSASSPAGGAAAASGLQGEGNGEGGEGEGEADADGDGESDAAEAEAAEAAAAEVSTAAAVAGVEVSVAAVDTSKNADAKGGTSVSINGVSMSVDDAVAAIGAIADAQAAGVAPAANPGAPGIDVDATLNSFAQGDHSVVGSASGVHGTVAEVTAAEVSVSVGRSATGATVAPSNASFDSRTGPTVAPLSDAAFNSRFGATITAAAAVPADNISKAINAATTYSGPKGTARGGLNEAALNAHSRVDQYTFDPNANPNTANNPSTARGGWVDQNGRLADVNSFPSEIHNQIDALAEPARQDPNLTVTIDVAESKVSITDRTTGAVRSFDPTVPVGQVFGQTYSGPRGVPTLGLNDASRYAARVYAEQQPVAVPTQNLEEDAQIIAALAMAEDPEPELAMETIANRAIARETSVRSIAASKEFQPVLDRAQNICNCRNPQQSHLDRALDSIVSEKSRTANFQTNVAIARSIMEGTHVAKGITTDKKGFVDFANVPLSISQGRASSRTISAITGMKQDPNSITLRSGRSNEQTFGIRAGSKVPDYTPQTLAFTPSTVPSAVNTGRHTAQPSTPTTPPTAQPTTPTTPPATVEVTGIPAIDETITTVINTGLETVDRVVTEVLGGFRGLFGEGGTTGNITPPTNTGSDNCELYPVVPCNGLSGSIITAIANNPLFRSWFKRDETANTINEINTVAAQPAVTVVLTVNAQTREIEINRPDINASLVEPELYYTQEQYDRLVELLEETPFLLNDEGEILYSNGLYTPPTVDGEPVDAGNIPDYAYVVEYVDETGVIVPISNNDEVLPENAATELIRYVFGNSSPFGIERVASVTYRLIDPDPNVPLNEYYDYVINLDDGSTRAITVPEFTSVSHMSERFGKIGYRGSAPALLSIATQTWEEPSKGWAAEALGFITTGISGFIDRLTSSDQEGTVTELPISSSSNLTAAEIENVYLYPAADINCPMDVPGYTQGFVYTAIVRDPTDPDYVIMVTDGRCGVGDANELVTETARHLSEVYGIDEVTYESIADKSFFLPGSDTPVIGTARVYDKEVATVSEVEPSVPEMPTETEPSSPTQLPNLTNEVVFEVKAVGSDGQVLVDWTEAERIEIGTGVQLYFRWSGAAYQQCLPFLNDNGNYALTVSNRAMLSGNTEAEGYNVSERSAVYRLECGGQRNNEFGVDAREIEVVVN